MREAGATPQQIEASRLAFDSKGLLREGVELSDPHKRELVASRAVLSRYGLDGADRPTPEEVIARFRPTILVGATATPGTFTQAMVAEMAKHVERPIVMPLSNPTSKAECTPREAIAWSSGRALVATGSPFADVDHEGVRHVIGQANNVFVFPGVGLGAILSEIQQIDEAVFLVAARTSADCVSDERLKQGALFPDTSELRSVSRAHRGRDRPLRQQRAARPPRARGRGRRAGGGLDVVPGVRPGLFVESAFEAALRPRMRSASFGPLLVLLLALPAAAQDFPSLGPAPRDAEGRFLNSVGALAHGSVGVRLPFFLRRIAGSFRTRPGAPARVANDGAFLRENAHHSEPTVTWIGHATLLVQMDHVTFLTDPIWSDTASPVSFGPRRFVPPGLALEDLPPIDFVLISHNHYDHLDLATLSALAAREPATRFFVPLGNAELLRENGHRERRGARLGGSREHAGVRVHCVPAQHWSRRGLDDARSALWSSWAVIGPTRRFYFAGDTGYFAGFVEIAQRARTLRSRGAADRRLRARRR